MYKLGLYKSRYMFHKKIPDEVIEDEYYSLLVDMAKGKIKKGYYQGILLKNNKLWKRVSKDCRVHTYMSKEACIAIQHYLRLLCIGLSLERNTNWVKMYSNANKLVIETNKKKYRFNLNDKYKLIASTLIANIQEACHGMGAYYIYFKPKDVVSGGNLLISWEEVEYNCVGVTIRKVINGRVVK